MTLRETIVPEGDLSTRNVNIEIKKALSEDKNSLLIETEKQLDSIAVGIVKESDIVLKGDVGDFVGALNDGAKILIDGNAGRYVGNNMTAGEIIVNGSADDGVGFGQYNGTIVVHGDAGNAVGQLNKGGSILIDGDIGDLAGLYMLSGDIIVTGNTGLYTGDWMIGGTIYVGGSFDTGTNAEVRELDIEDKLKLKKLFGIYKNDASPDNFIKIEPKELRPFYGD
ncbi:MAG: tributyrin esterase [Euryarchaeota archaeon]|nr:tributyrin esterase [Euryarchaeota archaeon]